MGEQLHTVLFPYGAGRTMQCTSVRNFEDCEPLNFNEIYEEKIAAAALHSIANNVAEYRFTQRSLDFGESGQISNMDAISAFLGSIGIRPFGKLSRVKSLTIPQGLNEPLKIETPGATINEFRQAFIIEDNIDMTVNEVIETNFSAPYVPRELYIEHAAVHELVHLAGTADITYFKLTHSADGRLEVPTKAHGTTLEKHEGGFIRGKFYEEGFATLCGHMYLWSRFPGIVDDKQTEPKQSPSGIRIDLPIRHVFAASAYAYAAWGIEQLVNFSPQFWNALVESRTYGIPPEEAREGVKKILDPLGDEMFNIIDKTDMTDLEQVMMIADFINEMIEIWS